MLKRPVASCVAAIALAAQAFAVPPDRADLGEAYLRYERAVEDAKPAGEARAKANRAFDALTGAFFAGDFATALTSLAEATAAVRHFDEKQRDGWRFVASRRAQGVPRAVVAGTECDWGITWGALDGVGVRRAETVDAPAVRWSEAPPSRIVVIGSAGEVGSSVNGESRVAFRAPVEPETLRVCVDPAGGAALVEIARVAVLREPLPALRERFAQRLRALAEQPGSSAVAEALRARVGLLADMPDRARSASLLAELPRLVEQLDEEFDIADRGENPFSVLDEPGGVRRGLHWREHRLLGAKIPVARFVPEGEGPFPLVIAFHGAGGDECMFFEGYGRGELRRLAERERFIAVCPATIPFAASPNLLDALVGELATELPIDRSRVYVLGHSLGAVTAGRLAALRPKSVVAAGLIAGFADVPRKAQPARRRLWAAELDPIFPASGLERQRDEAARTGRPIEWTLVPDEGHTLVVGAVLPEVVAWLLAQAPADE